MINLQQLFPLARTLAFSHACGMARETNKSSPIPVNPNSSINSHPDSEVLIRFEDETSGERLALILCGQTIRRGSGASKREALDAALASEPVDLLRGVP